MHTCHRFAIIALLLILVAVKPVYASHIVGGEVTYKFLGSSASGKTYQVSLSIYEDCLNGSPEAIEKDNPAFYAVYDQDRHMLYFDSVRFSSSTELPPNYNIACLTNPPELCVARKTFVFSFVLPNDHRSFYVAYQRCCRNGDIMNIVNPSNTGATYYCQIPSDTVAATNNSAVFRNYPPMIICANTPLYHDNSATDADGDSLTYMLCDSYDAPNGFDNNIIPEPPPYSSVTFKGPSYSYAHPLNGNPPLSIDPVTGIITAKPAQVGRYLVTVCCNEWRHGVLINTIHREFQFVVTNCSKAIVADMPYFTDDPDIYMVNCQDYHIDFWNTSTGAGSYHWDFGVQDNLDDTSSIAQPSYNYPDTGIYTVKLVANPGEPCADSIQKLVKVFPKFTSGYEDTGLNCPSSQVGFLDRSVATTSPANSWLWRFGDGDTAQTQNAVHTYNYGGTFNVMLIARNAKGCTDTTVKQRVIEIFKPFAGLDTTIVKGESIQFNATGGMDYVWSPPLYLKFTNGNNPVGEFPDTGTYTYVVTVTSNSGCKGADTIVVKVVDHAAFFLPTGFTPNGDGLNDVFRPVTIGFRSITYFRIFNRYGQQVYLGDNITEGWDGTYNNKQADIGTYYFTIGYIDRFGKEGNMRGDVTLVR